MITTAFLFYASNTVVVRELTLESRKWGIQPPQYQIIQGPYKTSVEGFIEDTAKYGYLMVSDAKVKSWAEEWLGNQTDRTEQIGIEDNYYLVTVKYIETSIYKPSLMLAVTSLALTIIGLIGVLLTGTKKSSEKSVHTQ
jgi:hypothetical protein